jgi:hypothetical protein
MDHPPFLVFFGGNDAPDFEEYSILHLFPMTGFLDELD